MYFSEYLVLEPSIYDEISSTRHLTRKYRLRQEGKELRRNISSESMCDLRGYFAPGDSVAHFTPERGLLLSSQQQGTFDLHPIVREYAYDRLVDKKAIHIRLRDCFTSVPVAKQPRNLRDLTPVIEVYHHTIGAGRYDEAWEVYNSRLRTSLYYELGEFELDFEREEKRIGEPHFLFTPLGTKSTLRNITKNFDPSACCGVNTRKPEK